MESGINFNLWRCLHARHCSKCSPTAVDDACYFRFVYHFLRAGFDPPCDVNKKFTPRSTRRAYVDAWNPEKTGCEKAFGKWKKDSAGLMSGVSANAPESVVPLLPVVKSKDR